MDVQEHFEAVRAAELVATQRLEAAERRKMEEKERRMAQVHGRIQKLFTFLSLQCIQMQIGHNLLAKFCQAGCMCRC